MTVVALASAKGSPGVTTTAIALAARWPSPRQAVVMELDPAGGDIGAWFGLSGEPGVGSLAAGSRRGVAAGSLLDHCQHLPGGLRVVVGPPGAEQARRAVAMLAPTLPSASHGGEDVDVLADCGRLDEGSPATDVVRHADVAVLVSRADVAALGHLAALVAALLPACQSLGVLMVGRGPYPPAEVSEAIGTDVVGVLPYDADGAALVAAGRQVSRAGRRSLLLRSAADLAGVVTGDRQGGGRPATVPVERASAHVSGNGAGPRGAR